MSATGQLDVLLHQVKNLRWSVLGLCETRWTGAGEFCKDDVKVIYSGRKDDKHQEGVALILRDKAIGALIGYNPIGPRIISAQFKTSCGKATVIQVYAPTANSTEEDIEDFYSDLQAAIQKASSRDLLIVMGDFNAKVGRDWSTWGGAIGKFGFGDMNDRGERLLNFCLTNNLRIMNTAFFQKKGSRKWTWESPDGTTKNLIDYILVNSRWKSSVSMCRSFPKPDVGTDHQMVMANIRIRLGKVRKKTITKRYDVEKLSNDQVKTKYGNRIREEAFDIVKDEEASVEETWNNIKNMYNDVAKEVLGYKKRQRLAPWISSEVLEMSDQRKALKPSRKESEENRKRYNKLTRDIKKKSKECKDKWIEGKCQVVENSARSQNAHKLFKTANEICGIRSAKLPTIKDKAGQTIDDQEKIKSRWAEYYKELYNEQNPVDDTILREMPPTNSAEHMEDFLEEEVKAAIQTLKRGKAPGEDNITAEMILAGGDSSISVLHTLCQKIYHEGKCPADWGKAVIVPLHKKGDKMECSNYRGISLLSIPSKVYTKVLQQRLKKKVEEVLAEEQAGFRPGRGTVDQIFVIRQLAEKFFERNRTLYNNFIDFKQAFDSVWQQGLWQALRNNGIPEDLVLLLEDLYSKSVSAVRVDGELTEWFSVTVGVRQGCNLSPYLFNLLLEAMMKEALKNVDAGVAISGQVINNLRFADDIDLIAESPQQLQDITNKVHESSKRFGLKINEKKTKTMTIGKTHEEIRILLDNIQLEQVTNFVYLGSQITEDAECEQDIKRRAGLASAMVGKLNKIWRSRSISLATKVKVYEALVIPVFMYGSECWKLRKSEERKIGAIEMGWLRRILGVSRIQRLRNDFIRSKLKQEETLCERIEKRRLRWFGHVERMEDSRLPQRALHCYIEGQRSRGRPRKTWMDSVKQDLEKRSSNIRSATELAQDRIGWRTFVQSHRQLS